MHIGKCYLGLFSCGQALYVKYGGHVKLFFFKKWKFLVWNKSLRELVCVFFPWTHLSVSVQPFHFPISRGIIVVQEVWYSSFGYWRLPRYHLFLSWNHARAAMLINAWKFYMATKYNFIGSIFAATGAIFSATDSVCTLQVGFIYRKVFHTFHAIILGWSYLKEQLFCDRSLARMRLLYCIVWFLVKVWWMMPLQLCCLMPSRALILITSILPLLGSWCWTFFIYLWWALYLE